jgi:hypothetical protein
MRRQVGASKKGGRAMGQLTNKSISKGVKRENMYLQ